MVRVHPILVALLSALRLSSCRSRSELWSKIKYEHQDSSNEFLVDLLGVNSEVCTWDLVQIGVVFRNDDQREILLCVQEVNDPLAVVASIANSIDGTNMSAVLSCELNEEDCVPNVISLSIRDVSRLPRSIYLQFDVPVRPHPLPNSGQLRLAFEFIPPLTGM